MINRFLLSLFLCLALFGALAAAGAELLACQKCDTAGDLVGNLPLGAIGAAFYTLLFLISLFRPHARMLWWALLGATALHGGLLLLLLRAWMPCMPCIFTASACAGAATAAWNLRHTPAS